MVVSTALELCWIASGKTDGFLNVKPSVGLSSLAGRLLVQEAGGKITALSGKARKNIDTLAVSNGLVHDSLIKIINDHYSHNYQKQSDAIEKANKEWDKKYSNCERATITYDNWLESFQSVIENCKTPIIDLGCGSGNDTLCLIKKGKEVIPCDYSSNVIQNIKKNFPEVKNTECFDMSKGLPFDDNFTDLIICDLSLHYFIEEITFKILEEIKRVLKPNGILLFRVNSIKDINHGAGEGKEIEPHLYETSDGRYKRFFNQKDIEKFFADWENLFVHEEVMKRYEKEKVLWKCAMRVKK